MLVILLVLSSTALGAFITSNVFTTTPNTTLHKYTQIPATSSSTLTPTPSWSPFIATENAQPGTTAWELDKNIRSDAIQGYAGNVSAAPGSNVPLYISSMVPLTYDLAVYRLGWYQGKGAREMLTVPHLQGQTQGYWTPSTGLVGCKTCLIDTQTHLLDAHWNLSYTVHVGADWPSGVYLAKLSSLTNQLRAESYIPFVVTNDQSHSNILVTLPVNTYQAYNYWGGFSLYRHIGPGVGNFPFDRATKVSFNRPYALNAGTSDLLNWDINTIRFLEHNTFDVSYITNSDLADTPEIALNHKIFMSIGHDEYWTKSMYDGVVTARDKGINLAFLGANDIYWQARYELDSDGNHNRTLVCYKIRTESTSFAEKPARDPMYATNKDLVTAQWRDPLLARPESTVLGLMYQSYINWMGPKGERYLPTWYVAKSMPVQLSAGTNLKSGMPVEGGITGYEYDVVFSSSPHNLIILGTAPLINVYGNHGVAATAMYTAPSGAIVFDAGSMWWGRSLDDYQSPYIPAPNPVHGNKDIEQLTINIITAMLNGHLQP